MMRAQLRRELGPRVTKTRSLRSRCRREPRKRPKDLESRPKKSRDKLNCKLRKRLKNWLWLSREEKKKKNRRHLKLKEESKMRVPMSKKKKTTTWSTMKVTTMILITEMFITFLI